MANTVKLKRSSVAGKVPTTSDLQLGELALNTYDGKLFTKKDDGTASIVELSGGGGGGGITYTFSSSPPTSPNAGDEWTDSDDGITYKYVNDGTSSQWIEFGTATSKLSPIPLSAQVISQNLSLDSGYNGISAGPVEVAATYAVTVPANATWMVL